MHYAEIFGSEKTVAEGLTKGDERERRDLIKEIAAAVSVQAQVANRSWLALMTVALIAVLPRNTAKSGNVSLPFNLGEVDASWFHAVVFSILVVLAIAFAAAYAQAVRAHKLSQPVVDALADEGALTDRVHPRELYDMLRMPSLNRVASLAQSLRGEYQFFRTGLICPLWLRLLSVSYYGLLKFASMVVYFGLPLWALWQAYITVSNSSSLMRGTLAFFGLFAALAIFQVLLTDVLYSLKILKLLWHSPKPQTAGTRGRGQD
jgi:hypothetical protein